MKESKSLNTEVLNLLISYFETEVPLLESSYSWKIPMIDGFENSLEKGFYANVELKKFLNSLWNQADKTDFEVAEIIIKDWGGVKGNKPETIEAYIALIRNNRFETPFKGLASYTKLYSIVEPQRFAIYDARVAVTLNALQCNAKIESGIAFNYLSGRNNTTGNTTNKQGFSQQQEYSIASLVKRGWERIAKEDTYQIYLDYLFACIEHNPHWKLYELEMVLFANAEKEARKAMKFISDTELTSFDTDTLTVEINVERAKPDNEPSKVTADQVRLFALQLVNKGFTENQAIEFTSSDIRNELGGDLTAICGALKKLSFFSQHGIAFEVIDAPKSGLGRVTYRAVKIS